MFGKLVLFVGLYFFFFDVSLNYNEVLYIGVTVLGIQHKTGEYEGIHYDNYNLHCVDEVSGDTWQRGSRITYVEKVPAEVFYQANAVDQILPGHEYNIIHNRFGRPIDVQLIK